MGQPQHVRKMNISKLAWVTRTAAETVSKRLRSAGVEPVARDGRAIFFDPRAAIPILLGVGEGLNPQAERARLDRARAELTESALRARMAELVEARGVDRSIVALRDRVTAAFAELPSQLAILLAGETDPQRCSALVEEEVHRVLHVLADEEGS